MRKDRVAGVQVENHVVSGIGYKLLPYANNTLILYQPPTAREYFFTHYSLLLITYLYIKQN